jgi:sugar phosphate permease
MTALIGAFLGLILIGLTNFIIRGNRHVAHLIVLVTLIFSITTGVMGYKSSINPELDEVTKSRRVIVFAVMSASCLAATGYYIMGFIERKKRLKLEESNLS